MSNLIPFEDSSEAIAVLSSGKALIVEFVFDDDGPYKKYKDYYFDLLGYDQKSDAIYSATILSEIGNMPGHYMVVGGNGKVICGLHGDLFHVDLDELHTEFQVT